MCIQCSAGTSQNSTEDDVSAGGLLQVRSLSLRTNPKELLVVSCCDSSPAGNSLPFCEEIQLCTFIFLEAIGK